MDPATSTRLMAVLRRPDGLFGLISTRRAPFERPVPAKEGEEAEALALPEGGPYVEELWPAAKINPDWTGRKELLLRSWNALAAVERFDAEFLANLLIVLTESLPDPLADTRDIPALVLEEPPAPPRPTAAHPRAYRGTKYKPPKPPHVGPIDLRPHLGVPADEARLLAKLSPHLDEAVTRVAKEHPFGKVLREWGPSILRPFGQLWGPECREPVAALPPLFRRYLLWNLRACDWEHVGAALAAYWALGLEQDEALRRCVSQLLAIHAGSKGMVDWCHLIAQMPPHRRVHFAELLIESSAADWRGPSKSTMDGLLRADALSSDAVYRHRMFYALSTVKEECSLTCALDGFELANEYCENYRFEEVAELNGAGAAVRKFAAHAKTADDWWDGYALTLWDRCTDAEGFKSLLEDLDWTQLDPSDAIRFLDIFVSMVYEEISEEAFRRKWRLLRDQVACLFGVVTSVPRSHQAKVIRHLKELEWIWGELDGLWAIIEPHARLIQRICAPPFPEDGYSHWTITDLSFIGSEYYGVVERLPDDTLLKIESATRRKNEASLIGQGLRSLVRIWPSFAAEALQRHPSKFIAATRTLGAISRERRDTLLETFRKHPLASTNEREATSSQLIALLAEYARPGITNPVSKRLRAHLRGEQQLRPSQLERDIARVREGWLGVQLDLLEQFAIDHMAEGLPAAERTAPVIHALMMQQRVEKNRRSLRRLLKAYLSGHAAFADEHPKNRAWLAKHPKLDAATWMQGLRYRGPAGAAGVLDLAIERDALEVLRLGSYVGSCLGLGGDFAYSAAAIVLDVNKQVVYARNAAGRVVARQLVAISEEEQLVCFAVYPKSVSSAIRELFREFNLRLANLLGMPVYEPESRYEEPRYTLVSVLSRDFWDDGAWDLGVNSD